MTLRKHDIDRICNKMGEINLLFKQVQDTVYDQGSIVDRIDVNISSANRNVKNANQELEEVERSP